MSDPRLCSIHFEANPRRADYRKAREALLGACGQHTIAVDRKELAEVQARQTIAPGAAPADMHYWLMDKESVYPLKMGLNTIGRMPDNDIAILDGSISRRHAAIVVHVSETCEVHDTASKNGTFLNGQKISGPTAIKAGDEIRLCDRALVFLAKAGAVPPERRKESNEHTIVVEGS